MKATQFSKKLTLTVFCVVVLILDSNGLVGLKEQHVDAVVWVMIAYLGGQSVVDALSYKEEARANAASNQVLDRISRGEIPPRLRPPQGPPLQGSHSREIDSF